MGNHSKQKHVILKTKGACKGGNMKERRGRGQLLLFCTLRGRSLTTLARRCMYLGGTENVNGMQIFPFNSKGVISPMSNKGK